MSTTNDEDEILTWAAERIQALEAERDALAADNERMALALARLNQLRRNVTSTQSASWSNALYPMVAILNAAGYTDPLKFDENGQGGRQSEAQMDAHLDCYGGAGGFPEPEADAFVCRPDPEEPPRG